MAPRRPPIVAQERRTRRRCSSRRRSESSATTCVPPDPPFSISVTCPADSRFCRVVCRRPVAASQNATRWRPAGATDQPLFLYYAPHLVHQPYEVPQRYLDAFAFIDVLERRQYHAMARRRRRRRRRRRPRPRRSARCTRTTCSPASTLVEPVGGPKGGREARRRSSHPHAASTHAASPHLRSCRLPTCVRAMPTAAAAVHE